MNWVVKFDHSLRYPGNLASIKDHLEERSMLFFHSHIRLLAASRSKYIRLPWLVSQQIIAPVFCWRYPSSEVTVASIIFNLLWENTADSVYDLSGFPNRESRKPLHDNIGLKWWPKHALNSHCVISFASRRKLFLWTHTWSNMAWIPEPHLRTPANHLWYYQLS